MNTPLVSVIIPTYNAENFIDDAVKSILDQTYRNIELIIVDDGSTDDTKNILEKYSTKIKYLYQDNRGPNEARNTGIEIANGELIAYQDADDVSHPSRIEKEVELLIQNPSISMVYTGMVNIRDGKSEKRWGRSCDPFTLLQINYIPCGTVMHWKNIFDKIGMWNENGDWDIWIRMSEEFQIGYIKDCLYNRIIHKNNISTIRGRLKNRLIDLQMFKDRYSRKNEWWIYFKVKRITMECRLIKILNFKNKRLEMVFFTCLNILSTNVEKMIYIITRGK